MTILTNLVVTGISFSYRVVLEGKTGKRCLDHLEVTLKASFSSCKIFQKITLPFQIQKKVPHNHIIESTIVVKNAFVENTISNLSKIPKATFPRSNRLLFY